MLCWPKRDGSSVLCYINMSAKEKERFGVSEQSQTRSTSRAEPLSRQLAGLSFLCVIALAPLPLGAARPWSGALLMSLMALCALAWAMVLLRHPDTPGIALSRLAAPMLCYGAAVGWGLLQTLPLLPESWAHPWWAQAEIVLGPLPPLVSMAPAAGRDGVMRLLGLGLAFFLAVQIGRSERWGTKLTDGLGLAASALAGYGVTVHLLGIERIFWLEKWAYQGDLTASLVNRNHYATLAGLGLLTVLAALLRRLHAFGRRGFLRRLLAGQDWPMAGLLVGGTLLSAALLMTHSRAGLAASLLAVLVFLLSAGRWRTRHRLLALALLVGFALLGLVALDQRVGALGVDGEQRLRVYGLSWQLLWQRPWLGIGLGGFADAFQAIRPVQVTQFWGEAHNSWLEMMIELGIPASLCLFLAALWAAGRCLIGVASRRYDRELPALGLAASVLVGSHAMVDFSLQIPAVAATWAMVLGIGVAQSWSSQRGKVVT